jgi:hypothetical protein
MEISLNIPDGLVLQAKVRGLRVKIMLSTCLPN